MSSSLNSGFDGRLVLMSTSKKLKRWVDDITSWLEALLKDLLHYPLLILWTHCLFAGHVWLVYNLAFCKHAAATNHTDWSTINVQLFNFHAAGASGRSGCELSYESTEPHDALSSLITNVFVSPEIKATALFLLCHAASVTNALVALAHTTLELALLSHPANLVLLASGKSMLPLLILVASLGTNGLDQPFSLSRVHPTLSLACFRLEDLSLQV